MLRSIARHPLQRQTTFCQKRLKTTEERREIGMVLGLGRSSTQVMPSVGSGRYSPGPDTTGPPWPIGQAKEFAEFAQACHDQLSLLVLKTRFICLCFLICVISADKTAFYYLRIYSRHD